MTKSEQKKELREKMRAERESLTSLEVKQASNDICSRLIRYLGASQGKQFHVYTAKTNWKEIDISTYIEWLKDQNKNIKIDVAAHMPVQAIPSQQYDIVLIPMLAFDSNLQRLGMGMGWYDMFLAKQQHALKIGLAYDWAELKEIVAEEHDIYMDVIITPTRVLTR